MQIFYSDEFKKSAKKLAKRYKNFKGDLQKFIGTLEKNPRQGTELSSNVYKVRIKNSNNNKGKSAGYRIITYIITNNEILLVNIFSKSDIPNISEKEIDLIIKQYIGKYK